MKIVILAATYAKSMGYAGTLLPAALSRRPDIEVHYVTTGLPHNYYLNDFEKTYGNFQGEGIRRGTVRAPEGYTVHFIDFHKTYGGMRMRGLDRKLAEIRPDVVQTFTHTGWLPIDAARFQPKLGYKLFTGCHTTASVFPLAQQPNPPWDRRRLLEFVRRGLPGRFISSRIELCYGATADCTDVARKFFGADPRKLKTIPLGVDTEIFHPARDDQEREAAAQLRRSLGVADDEIMCVYTGRFAEDKNPVLLALAVASLRAAGERSRAVFFGDGAQRQAIEGVPDAIVHPFVHYTKLGDLYRAADVGLWPAQKSTSMIDCAACGTAIVVNDTIAAVERVEGNGITYRLNRPGRSRACFAPS